MLCLSCPIQVAASMDVSLPLLPRFKTAVVRTTPQCPAPLPGAQAQAMQSLALVVHLMREPEDAISGCISNAA